MQIDKYQSKLVLTLEEFVNRQRNEVDIPDIQRNPDEDRIMDIIQYQIAHFEKEKSLCFIGDFTVYEISGKWLIVDGMHRYFALKSPCIFELQPTYKICVNIVSGISLETLFLLINKAQPVPQYVIETTMDRSKRMFIESLRHFMSQEYKCFISKSDRPRPPNFSINNFLDVFIKSPILDRLQTLENIIGFIKYMNVNLSCPEKIKQAILIKSEKNNAKNSAFFCVDPYYSWMFDEKSINNYIHEKQKPTPQETGDIQNKKRKSIPKAIRHKLWKEHYSEAYEGKCKCCFMNTISFFDFDVGHIVSKNNGGSDLFGNLLPICRSCNNSMGTTNLYNFQKKISVF